MPNRLKEAVKTSFDVLVKRSEAWTDPDGIFHHEHTWYGEPLHKKQQDLAKKMGLKDYQLSRLLSNKSRKLSDLHKKILLEQINHQMMDWTSQPLMDPEELEQLLWKDLHDAEEMTIADEISKTVENKLREMEELEFNLNAYVEKGFDRIVHQQTGVQDALAAFAEVLEKQQELIDSSFRKLREQGEIMKRFAESIKEDTSKMFNDESDAA
tara:strand:+ start:226 stop:858 length:633 start_codon:yes stop_codon:yes gene_type:complete